LTSSCHTPKYELIAAGTRGARSENFKGKSVRPKEINDQRHSCTFMRMAADPIAPLVHTASALWLVHNYDLELGYGLEGTPADAVSGDLGEEPLTILSRDPSRRHDFKVFDPLILRLA
jgi:hypothetical protein